jgi:uncharacterized Zn-binding protein involved in type VI secretion
LINKSMPALTRVNANQAGAVIVGPGSATVFCEGNKVSLVGDLVAGHGKSPHAAPKIVGTSSTVFATGKTVTRAGDAASCGHAANGASTTFAG